MKQTPENAPSWTQREALTSLLDAHLPSSHRVELRELSARITGEKGPGHGNPQTLNNLVLLFGVNDPNDETVFRAGVWGKWCSFVQERPDLFELGRKVWDTLERDFDPKKSEYMRLLQAGQKSGDFTAARAFRVEHEDCSHAILAEANYRLRPIFAELLRRGWTIREITS